MGMLWMWRAVALVAVLASAGCDSVEDRIERHYARGLELIEKDDPKRAWLEFRNAVRLNENHAPSRFEIAKLYEADGELRAAIGNYRLVADLDTQHVEARLRLAQLLILANALDDAQAYADEAVAIAPEDPDALATRAAVLLRRDAKAEAVAEAAKALAIAPDHVNASLVLVSDMIDGGRNDEALARMDALIADNRDNLVLHTLKLQLLDRLGDEDAIGDHLSVMVGQFPDRRDLRRTYVQWLVRNERFDDAAGELRTLADAQPGDVGTAVELIRFIASQEGIDAARAELAARTAAAPETERAAFTRARADLEVAARNLDAAKAILQEVIDANEASSSDGAAARVRLAELSLQGGKAEEAKALADAVLAADPSDIGAVAIRASVMIEQYQAADAVLELRRALEQAPQNVQLMQLLALAYERSGSPDLAGERLAAAVRASNYAPEVALRYATFLQQRGQTSAVETVLTEAARVNPTNRQILGALAELQLRLQKFDAAQRTVAALRTADPDDALASRIEAAALNAQGRFDESVQILEQLSTRSDQSSTLAALIGAYVRSGDVARAEAVLDEAIATRSDDLTALLLRAELHILRGQLQEAEAKLLRITEIAPTEAVGYMALSRFYSATGRSSEAEAIARKGIESATRSAPIRLLLAQFLELRRAYGEAIAEYRQLYDANRDSAIFANNLASLIAEHQADDPEAVAFASRVAQRLRGATVPEMQDTYGWIKFLEGNTDEALRNLIPAAAALPNNPYVQYHAGQAYAAVGQNAEARQHLERALAIAPDFSKAESARSTLEKLAAAN